MRTKVSVSCPVSKTPRVLQVSSLFDLPLEAKTSRSWDVQLPIEDTEWSIGLIAGPSGSGKTTIAKHLWPGALAAPLWSHAAIVDDFPEMPIKDIVGHLTAVGLSSTPTWIRPFSTLSNGEAFRADMARVLAETPEGQVAVVDEFTSVVDRQVAQVASHAVQKAVRRAKRRLIACSCHYDIIDWLQPDWVLDAATGAFTWRSVQPRPRLTLEIYPVERAAWALFKDHHYLSPILASGAHCYGGWVDGELAVFSSYIHFPHAKMRDMKMAHRIVVLPDYQGLGLAGRVSEWQGQYLHEHGKRYRIVTGHPAFLHYLRGSPRWRDMSPKKVGFAVGPNSGMRARQLDPRRMITRSFEYAPPKVAHP